MNTVTLIRRRSGFVNVRDSFAVVEKKYEDRYDEFTETVEKYYLPAGYHIAKSQIGESEIYDAQNRHCELVEHRCGRPQIVTYQLGQNPVMDRAQ